MEEIVADKVYGQYCGLAKALDLVGERWTLLIIRELFFGPRRFSDLVEGLRGISTSVLNERLNRLEDGRLIIRRTLPPPAASKVYELTEDGQELGRAIVPLAAWGVRILAANRRKRTEAFRPAWELLFLRETFDASSARDVHDVYEFHVDDSVISVIVDDGEMQVIEGQSGRPVDVEIHVDATTFIVMRYAKGSCDSWAAKRLFAATRASFARWLCRDRVAHVSIVTAGRSITVHGAGDQIAPQLVGRNLFRSEYVRATQARGYALVPRRPTRLAHQNLLGTPSTSARRLVSRPPDRKQRTPSSNGRPALGPRHREPYLPD
jgi:DNA-binding HxlR family transcriptional regulator